MASTWFPLSSVLATWRGVWRPRSWTFIPSDRSVGRCVGGTALLRHWTLLVVIIGFLSCLLAVCCEFSDEFVLSMDRKGGFQGWVGREWTVGCDETNTVGCSNPCVM